MSSIRPLITAGPMERTERVATRAESERSAELELPRGWRACGRWAAGREGA